MKVTYKNPGFEHSIESILLFQNDSTTPFWSESLLFFYPQIKKEILLKLTFDEKKNYITEELENVWKDSLDELNGKVELYNQHFRKHQSQIEDALSDAFNVDACSLFNDLTGNISLNPISPRFLEDRYFDLFYKNSERGALGMSLHEIIHYMWFHVWNSHFGDNYSEYEKPSLKWILSEMVVESIMDDERLSSINPYYPRENGGCVYPYFQNMVINGSPILDTLRKMYKQNQITDYMEKSYQYCQKHESAIRRQIEKAEETL